MFWKEAGGGRLKGIVCGMIPGRCVASGRSSANGVVRASIEVGLLGISGVAGPTSSAQMLGHSQGPSWESWEAEVSEDPWGPDDPGRWSWEWCSCWS
jgi:hypothetical protein